MRTLEMRRVPPLGGFNLTFLALEVRRVFRNRRTLILTLALPVIFFFLFNTGRRGAALQASEGAHYEALVMIGLAVYGAMLAATSGGAMVSIERAQGWSRQLRLTPLRPPAYIAIKLLTAMTLGLLSVLAMCVVGAISGVQLSIGVWVASAALAWAARSSSPPSGSSWATCSRPRTSCSSSRPCSPPWRSWAASSSR